MAMTIGKPGHSPIVSNQLGISPIGPLAKWRKTQG